MSASFVVYIDESGDEGFKFSGDAVSSSWFVLSAAVFRKEYERDAVLAVRETRDLLKRGSSPSPLHFTDLKHEQRVAYLNRIMQARMWCVSVLVHKPSIYDQASFQSDRHRLYRYIVRYLTERVSWLCRDHARRGIGDGTAEIVFSHRRGMSYDDIRKYLQLLESRDTTIHWPAIDHRKISAVAHGNRMGLQIADAVASSFFKALEPKYGFTESRYVEILKPTIWRREGNCRNYGVKIWPREAMAAVDLNNNHAWLKKLEQ